MQPIEERSSQFFRAHLRAWRGPPVSDSAQLAPTRISLSAGFQQLVPRIEPPPSKGVVQMAQTKSRSSARQGANSRSGSTSQRSSKPKSARGNSSSARGNSGSARSKARSARRRQGRRAIVLARHAVARASRRRAATAKVRRKRCSRPCSARHAMPSTRRGRCLEHGQGGREHRVEGEGPGARHGGCRGGGRRRTTASDRLIALAARARAPPAHRGCGRRRSGR